MNCTAQLRSKETKTVGVVRAIVVGGSLTGLLAARVLGEYFSEVTIVERDKIPDEATPRPGVPHSRHVHGLLPRGLQIVEAFFPGIREELESCGAVPLDIGNDIAWLTAQGWGLKFRSGFEALSLTRDLLDWIVRRRVQRQANVKFVDATEVVGLLRDDNGRILGIRTRQRKLGEDGSPEDIRADLAVIATGRQNAIAKWFAEVGLEQPQVTTINAHIGYASRIYRRSGDSSPDWKAIILHPTPPDTHRSGLMFPIEGSRWVVTLIGADRDYPPNDEAGFLEFAKSLRDPSLYNAVRKAAPLTAIFTYRATENRRNHFLQLENWPEGLIVLGDAACAFNPVYAQGMSTAAIEAARLHSLLCDAGPRPQFGRQFQQDVARIVQSPWVLATSADLRYRSVEGPPANRKTRVMHWYLDQVLRLGTTDEWVRRRFLEVQGMLRDGSAILKADMLFRVLSSLLRSWVLRQPTRESSWPSVSAPSSVDPSDSAGPLTDAGWNHVDHPDLASDVLSDPSIGTSKSPGLDFSQDTNDRKWT